MVGIIVKSDRRKAAEAKTLREFGIDARVATGEQREYAEQITADNKVVVKELRRMEEMSR
jgi:hypothetical protein